MFYESTDIFKINHNECVLFEETSKRKTLINFVNSIWSGQVEVTSVFIIGSINIVQVVNDIHKIYYTIVADQLIFSGLSTNISDILNSNHLKSIALIRSPFTPSASLTPNIAVSLL